MNTEQAVRRLKNESGLDVSGEVADVTGLLKELEQVSLKKAVATVPVGSTQAEADKHVRDFMVEGRKKLTPDTRRLLNQSRKAAYFSKKSPPAELPVVDLVIDEKGRAVQSPK